MSFPSDHRPFWRRLNIGRAEIGILLPFVSLFLSYILWSIMDLKTVYSFYSVIFFFGLILFMSDRKGFLLRMKGNKFASVLLVILGLYLIAGSLFSIRSPMEGPMTPQIWANYYALWVFGVLMFVSGLLWLLYGFKAWGYNADA